MHSKRNFYESEQATYRIGENVCNLHVRQRSHIQNVQGTKKNLREKKPNPIKKWATDMNRHFLKEDIYIANKRVKKSLLSAVTREMQIETTMRYQLTSVRTSGNNRCW